VGAYRHIVWVPSAPDAVAPMAALTAAIVESAGGAVTLAIGQVGCAL
jgi:hypothetical protein